MVVHAGSQDGEHKVDHKLEIIAVAGKIVRTARRIVFH